MKTFRSGRFLVFALMVLTAASFGCKRKTPGTGTTDGTGVDPLAQTGTTDGTLDGSLEGDEMRPTGLAGDASSVLQTVYFEYDRADLRPDQQSVLDGNAQWMKDNPDAKVQIEGHCDERGTVEYNFALGDRRAKSVRSYLMDKGIDGSRMVTTSKGEEEPASMGSSESDYEQNRRAKFIFVQ